MSAQDPIIAAAGQVAYLPKVGAIVTATSATPGTKPTSTPLNDDDNYQKWALWGSDNKYPQKIMAAIEKSTVGGRAMNFKVKAHYAQGIQLFKLDVTEDNREDIQLQALKNYPDIRDFFNQSKIKRYMLESITDFEWFANTFPELIVSKDFSKITNIRSLEAAFCRFGVKDTTENRINKLYYSANWPDPAEDEIDEIPVADPWWTAEEVRQWCKENNYYKFVYPTFYPYPGRVYYRDAYWHGAYKGGWLEFANEIAAFKKAIMKNQMAIKYHIEIPFNYWSGRYKDWNSKTAAEQKNLQQEEFKQMDNFLTGSDNAGKSFFSHYGVDPVKGTALPGWKITPLATKIEGGEYIADAQSANSEILFAMGVDPSLIGAGMPGGKLGAGSGSDKREAYMIYIANLKTDREVTTEPLHFIRDYNGWDPDIYFGIKDTVLTTLDKNPTGSQKTIAG